MAEVFSVPGEIPKAGCLEVQSGYFMIKGQGSQQGFVDFDLHTSHIANIVLWLMNAASVSRIWLMVNIVATRSGCCGSEIAEIAKVAQIIEQRCRCLGGGRFVAAGVGRTLL